MKKLIASLLYIGLLTNSVSAISIGDIYRCRPSQPDPSCSKAKRQEAETWFMNAKIDGLRTLAADLAALGTRVTIIQLQKEQELVKTEPVNAAESVTQRSEQFKAIQKRVEEMQGQRQKVVGAVAG